MCKEMKKIPNLILEQPAKMDICAWVECEGVYCRDCAFEPEGLDQNALLTREEAAGYHELAISKHRGAN